MKIVVFPGMEAERREALAARFPKVQFVHATTEAEALGEMELAEAFLGKITPGLLAQGPRLRWVQALTVSLEHYIFPELVAHPCELTNMRGLFSDVIADQVMGYVICFARNLHYYIQQQMNRTWAPLGGDGNRVNFAAGPGAVNEIDRQHGHLAGKVMGIVGLGEIGREIATRAKAFGMRLVAVDPRAVGDVPGAEWVRGIDELPALLRESDYVVIAAPHTPRTAGLFNKEMICQMKPTAYLINIGRGAIVKLDDLAWALEAKAIAGAALDVFEVEPLPRDYALWTMPNVILTPHVAGYSTLIAPRHFGVLVENISRFLKHQPLVNVVDKGQWF